jgi:hypothetical protein
MRAPCAVGVDFVEQCCEQIVPPMDVAYGIDEHPRRHRARNRRHGRAASGKTRKKAHVPIKFLVRPAFIPAAVANGARLSNRRPPTPDFPRAGGGSPFGKEELCLYRINAITMVSRYPALMDERPEAGPAKPWI